VHALLHGAGFVEDMRTRAALESNREAKQKDSECTHMANLQELYVLFYSNLLVTVPHSPQPKNLALCNLGLTRIKHPPERNVVICPFVSLFRFLTIATYTLWNRCT